MKTRTLAEAVPSPQPTSEGLRQNVIFTAPVERFAGP